jgi:hypothetical protein
VDLLLLLTTNTVTTRPGLLPVSTTTTVPVTEDLKVTHPRLDLLSSSSTTAARKADRRRTSTVNNSTEHRKATTLLTIIRRAAIQATAVAADTQATAAVTRVTETGDRKVMRRDGRLIYDVLSVVSLSSLSSSNTLP